MSINTNPLVSIIIPAHNADHYLLDCVNSVIHGSYSNIEVLIIENGSTDSTREICQKLQNSDKRIKVFNLSSIGVSAARNFGIKNSNGEYICFIDADDIIRNVYVQYLVNLITQNNAEVAVATRIATFKKDSDISNFKTKENYFEWLGNSEQALEQILLYKMTVVSCFSKIFKKQFLINNNILFYENLYIGEGFNFNVLAFNNAEKIAFSNRIIYFYRVSNPKSAMTLAKNDKIQNGLVAVELLDRELENSSNSVRNAFDYAKWHTNFDFLLLMLSNQVLLNDRTLYNKLVLETRKGTRVAVKVKIGLKEQIKASLATFSPVIFGKIINKFRKRELSKQ